jgi:ribosomal protein S18 acetylase RimI-like enzyme
VITLASRRDLHDLLRLVRAYYRFEAIRFRPSAAAALRQLVTIPALGRAWIVRDQGRAVGYTILTFNFDVEFGGFEGILTDLYLRPGYRGGGFGRRLVDVASGYCRSRGVETIELQVGEHNEAGQAFYHRLGFERLARVVMAREVSS